MEEKIVNVVYFELLIKASISTDITRIVTTSNPKPYRCSFTINYRTM